MREHWEGIVVGRKTLDGVAGTSRPSRRAQPASRTFIFSKYAYLRAFPGRPAASRAENTVAAPSEGKAEARPTGHVRAAPRHTRLGLISGKFLGISSKIFIIF